MKQLQEVGATCDKELQRLDTLETEADQRFLFAHFFILIVYGFLYQCGNWFKQF